MTINRLEDHIAKKKFINFLNILSICRFQKHSFFFFPKQFLVFRRRRAVPPLRSWANCAKPKFLKLSLDHPSSETQAWLVSSEKSRKFSSFNLFLKLSASLQPFRAHVFPPRLTRTPLGLRGCLSYYNVWAGCIRAFL